MRRFFQVLRKFWMWAVIASLLSLLGYITFGEFSRWRSLRGELKEREEAIERASENIESLTQEIEHVNDPNFLEKEARQKLNLKREGEEVFVVVGLESILREENFTREEKSANESQGKAWSNMVNWLYYFLGK